VSDNRQTPHVDPKLAAPRSEASAAKAELLNWAAEADARSVKTRWKIGKYLVGGALATLGSVAIARAITHRKQGNLPLRPEPPPRVRSFDWMGIARVGAMLLPHGIAALKGAAERRERTRG